MSNLIKELREKQAQIVSEARERNDQITAETDEARAAELESQHDAAMAEFDRLGKQIKREEQMAEAERRVQEAEDQKREAKRPVPGAAEARGQDEGEELTYRQVFHDFLKRGGDMGDMSSEERNVLKSGAVVAETRAQTAGTTTAGGFTVPTELSNMIVQSMAMWGPMYDTGLTTGFNTSSGNPLKIPTVDDTTVTAEPHTEAAPLTDDGGKDVTFDQKSLDAYVFDTEFVRFSMELAQDSIFNVETLLGQLLGERLGRIANLQLTVGTGASAPNGVVTASTTGVTAAANGAIAPDEIIDLQHSVDPAYRMSPSVRFMFNDQTLAAVRKLKDGQGNYLWSMGDVQSGTPGTLLGQRYEINQAMAGIGATNIPMLFGDFSKYFVRRVGAPAIGVLRERFWPDLGIAGLIRFDGELGDTAAIKHLVHPV